MRTDTRGRKAAQMSIGVRQQDEISTCRAPAELIRALPPEMLYLPDRVLICTRGMDDHDEELKKRSCNAHGDVARRKAATRCSVAAGKERGFLP